MKIILNSRKGFTLKSKTISGFTLIELMVAITIVGILVALSTSAFLGARRSARDAERKADLEDIRSALEIYRADCSIYPADGEVLPGLVFDGVCNGANNTYMSEVPNDPLNGSRGYIYKYDQLTTSTYRLCAYLENGSGAVAACEKCDTGLLVDCNYNAVNP